MFNKQLFNIDGPLRSDLFWSIVVSDKGMMVIWWLSVVLRAYLILVTIVLMFTLDQSVIAGSLTARLSSSLVNGSLAAGRVSCITSSAWISLVWWQWWLFITTKCLISSSCHQLSINQASINHQLNIKWSSWTINSPSFNYYTLHQIIDPHEPSSPSPHGRAKSSLNSAAVHRPPRTGFWNLRTFTSRSAKVVCSYHQ